MYFVLQKELVSCKTEYTLSMYHELCYLCNSLQLSQPVPQLPVQQQVHRQLHQVIVVKFKLWLVTTANIVITVILLNLLCISLSYCAKSVIIIITKLKYCILFYKRNLSPVKQNIPCQWIMNYVSSVIPCSCHNQSHNYQSNNSSTNNYIR